MVRVRGLEPPRLSAYEPKSHAAASYATPAYFGSYRPTPAVVAFKVIRVISHRSDTVLKVRLTQKDLLWCIFGYRRHCIAKTSGTAYRAPSGWRPQQGSNLRHTD